MLDVTKKNQMCISFLTGKINAAACNVFIYYIKFTGQKLCIEQVVSSLCSITYIFRYITGSTKEVTRWKREKGASKVFKLKLTSRLPAQTLLFSVTSNKVQIIEMIIQDLKLHKDDRVAHSLIITGSDPVPVEVPGPVAECQTGVLIQRHDLRTTQEEADTIIVQQVLLIKGHVSPNIIVLQ